MEGTYASKTTDGEHTVKVSTREGLLTYKVSQALALEEALTDGLNVLPPYNGANPTGSQFALIDIQPVAGKATD